MAFLASLFSELGKRRGRIRKWMGDRPEAILEFSLLSGFVLGTLGLYLKPGMADLAPWGFLAPPIFLIGYPILDWRRQAELAAGADAEKTTRRYDIASVFWGLACAGIGLAAFLIALTSWAPEPPPAPPPPEPEWTPPPDAVPSDLSR